MIDSRTVASIAAAAVPTVTVLVGILINDARLGDMNARIAELRSHVDSRFGDMDRRFTEVDRRISDLDRKVDQRFDDAKDVWRAELHRVEEVLDARLKHLEER